MGNVTAKTSGEIASFMTPAKTNIKSLKVHFSPKQLGTGDPSPENVREIEGWDGVEVNGSGKNLAHIVGYSAVNSDSNNSRSISNKYGTTINTTEFSLPDTKLIITQTEHPNTTYLAAYANGYIGILVDNLVWGQKYNVSFKVEDIISNPLNASLEQNIKLLVPSGGSYSVKKIQGNRLFFNNIEWSPYPNTNVNRRNFEIRICGMSFTLSEFMVTPVDEDDFEYEPYQGNIYLDGWTKNLLDINHPIFTYSGCQRNTDGSITISSSNGASWTNDTVFAPLELKKGTYTISWRGLTENDVAVVNIRTSSDEYVNNIRFSNGTGTFTLDEDCNIKFKFSTSTYPVTGYVQIELGSEPTEYQPYVGTVYGGYVDLISGELTEEWFKHNLQTSVKYTKSSAGYNGWWFTVTTLGNKFQGGVDSTNPSTQLLSNVFTTNTKRGLSNGTNMDYVIKTWGGSTGADTSQFCFSGFSSEDIEDFYSFINQYKPVICYKLATPITHQLTPTQLQSFIGQNNFWSNADYVEIEYDLIETEDIQKCRKKIMLNQPHIESTIDDVANFTTNMKAPLKECKIYFNPIQEGSGDPSPDNVRNIVGWNGVEVNGCGKNLWNNEDIIYGYWTDDNGKQTVNQRGCRTQYIYVTSNITIQLFYYGVQPYSASIIELNYNKEFIKRTHMAWEGTTNPKSLTITTSNETRYIYAQTYIYTSSSSKMTYDILCSYKMQMEFDTITSYEPYKGNIYSEDWSSEVGTIYGGYVDLAKGELVAKWIKKSISSFTWTYNSTGICFRTLTNIKNKSYGVISPVLSNIYKTTNVGNTMARWANYDDFSISEYTGVDNSGNRKDAIHIKDSRYTTVSDFLNGVGNESIIYELVEPIHYSLTPQQLLTFKGENNIWSDTNGQTEVKFWTH